MACGESIFLFNKSRCGPATGPFSWFQAPIAYPHDARMSCVCAPLSADGIGFKPSGRQSRLPAALSLPSVKAQLREAGTVACPGIDQTLPPNSAFWSAAARCSAASFELRVAITRAAWHSVECQLLFSNARMALFQMPDALAASVRSLPQCGCSGCELLRSEAPRIRRRESLRARCRPALLPCPRTRLP